MLKISPTSVIQLLIDMADDKFGGGDYAENKAKILSTSSAFKKLT